MKNKIFLTIICSLMSVSCGTKQRSQSVRSYDDYVPINGNGAYGENSYSDLRTAAFKSKNEMPCGYYYDAPSLKLNEFLVSLEGVDVDAVSRDLNLVGLSLADERGNGGWVIQCKTSSDFDQKIDFRRREETLLSFGSKIIVPAMPRVLDYYEGCMEFGFKQFPLNRFEPLKQSGGTATSSDYNWRSQNGWIQKKSATEGKIEFELAPEGQDPIVKAKAIVARLQLVDPVRAEIYKQKVETFVDNTRFFKGRIISAQDTNRPYVPEGCVAEQIIAQRKPELPNDKLFNINVSFLKLLAEDQVGLILHEIIYAEALSIGKKNSRGSRYFNAWLASHETFTEEEYKDVLSQAGLPLTVTPF